MNAATLKQWSTKELLTSSNLLSLMNIWPFCPWRRNSFWRPTSRDQNDSPFLSLHCAFSRWAACTLQKYVHLNKIVSWIWSHTISVLELGPKVTYFLGTDRYSRSFCCSRTLLTVSQEGWYPLYSVWFRWVKTFHVPNGLPHSQGFVALTYQALWCDFISLC